MRHHSVEGILSGRIVATGLGVLYALQPMVGLPCSELVPSAVFRISRVIVNVRPLLTTTSPLI